MDNKVTPELSPKEKDSLDKQLARLEPKIVDAKHKYEDLVSQYHELYEKRHPEKRDNASRRNYSMPTRTATDHWIRYYHLWPARKGTNGDYRLIV